MDEKILKEAQKISEDMEKISTFIKRMDNMDTFSYHEQKYLPQPLKELLRPVLKEYQEKLFYQLKNL